MTMGQSMRSSQATLSSSKSVSFPILVHGPRRVSGVADTHDQPDESDGPRANHIFRTLLFRGLRVASNHHAHAAHADIIPDHARERTCTESALALALLLPRLVDCCELSPCLANTLDVLA